MCKVCETMSATNFDSTNGDDLVDVLRAVFEAPQAKTTNNDGLTLYLPTVLTEGTQKALARIFTNEIGLEGDEAEALAFIVSRLILAESTVAGIRNDPAVDGMVSAILRSFRQDAEVEDFEDFSFPPAEAIR